MGHSAEFPVVDLSHDAEEIIDPRFELSKKKMLEAFASQQYLENIERFLKAFDSAGIDPRIFSDPDLRAAAEIACADLTNLAEAYNALPPGTELSQVTRFKQLFSLKSIRPNLTLLRTRVSPAVFDFLQDDTISPTQRVKHFIAAQRWLESHPGHSLTEDTRVEGLPPVPRPVPVEKEINPTEQGGLYAPDPSDSGPRRIVSKIKGETAEGIKVARGTHVVADDLKTERVEQFDRGVFENILSPDQRVERFDSAELAEQLDTLARQREAQEAEQRALRRARLEQTISKLRRPEASTPVVDQEKEERAAKLREAIARANEKLSNPDLN